MFDTHAHLNFAAFQDNFDEVIKTSQASGVEYMVIPGSNIENSKRAVEIAQKYDNIYAAVGIHPFHLFGHIKFGTDVEKDFTELEELLKQDKVVAVGEVGLDRHSYKSKKYPDYAFGEDLFELQKKVFITQIKLAKKYQKSLMIHNRGAVSELLAILSDNWSEYLAGHTVFHFCEADDKLLDFAKTHRIYIGVDGDVTYDRSKQDFVKKIPLELLVLETDSPYIIPEPLKSQGETINKPKNLLVIAQKIAEIKKIGFENIKKHAAQNSLGLFKALE